MIMDSNDANTTNSGFLHLNQQFSGLNLTSTSDTVSPSQATLMPPSGANHNMHASSVLPPSSTGLDNGLVIANDQHCTNVYVANLPPTADATKIRELFSSVGNVLHVKVLLDIASGVSRGIAFVMFEDLPTARKACVLKNKVVLDGSVLQVRLAERSSLHASPDTHIRSNIVYIRNVPGQVSKEQVKVYCETNYGVVADVVPHPQSCELGGPSPFNMIFVTFQRVEDACRCVEGVDGKAPFGLPQQTHPYTMAKMINDIGGEMRKSILLRRRGSEPQSNAVNGGLPPKHGMAQAPQYMQISPQVIPLIPSMSATPPQSPPSSSLTPQRRDLQPSIVYTQGPGQGALYSYPTPPQQPMFVPGFYPSPGGAILTPQSTSTAFSLEGPAQPRRDSNPQQTVFVSASPHTRDLQPQGTQQALYSVFAPQQNQQAQQHMLGMQHHAAHYPIFSQQGVQPQAHFAASNAASAAPPQYAQIHPSQQQAHQQQAHQQQQHHQQQQQHQQFLFVSLPQQIPQQQYYMPQQTM